MNEERVAFMHHVSTAREELESLEVVTRRATRSSSFTLEQIERYDAHLKWAYEALMKADEVLTRSRKILEAS